MAETTVSLTFAHHWTDRRDPENVADVKPGEKVDVELELARNLVNASVASYSTKNDAKTAGDPNGRTAAEAKAEEKTAAETT